MADSLLIVIPAHNEAGQVGVVVRDVRATLPDADVLVVNDGSADETATEALAAGARVVSLPMNSGYGTALQTGYKYAAREGYDLVGQIDADGQHEARSLPKMLTELDRSGAHVVIGSRFLSGDGHYKPSVARKVGIALFSRIATLLTRQHVTDPTSGLQVMKGKVAAFFCSDVYPADYPEVASHVAGKRPDVAPL